MVLLVGPLLVMAYEPVDAPHDCTKPMGAFWWPPKLEVTCGSAIADDIGLGLKLGGYDGPLDVIVVSVRDGVRMGSYVVPGTPRSPAWREAGKDGPWE